MRLNQPIPIRGGFEIFLIFLALGLSNLPISALTFRAGTVRGFPGKTVDVPLYLNYRTNELRDVAALQADLSFEITGLTDSLPTPTDRLAKHVLASSRPSRGTRRLLVYSSENAVLTNGPIATIPFTLDDRQYRNFRLTLENVLLVRADASVVTATNVDGFIAVTPVFVDSTGQADGFFNVSSNLVDTCFVIQASTDFKNWTNIQTNNAAESLLEFSDPLAHGMPYRFYRALLCDSESGISVAAITQMPGGKTQIEFTGVTGRTYAVQASINLTHWETIHTSVGTNGPILFSDSSNSSAQKFYRIVEE